ncbi:MAG TPA: hypothetical protein VMZ28_12990 [Kofleriaceae bacterium]|nr:hypothetical protein [Kofleriaceae bacterium]
MRAFPYATAVLLVAASLAGCEKVDHENLDRWMSTENGADKLTKALRSGDHDADIRAHAAQNLILHPEALFGVVKDELDNMDKGDAQAVMEKLAPRLWENARIAGEMDVPTPEQAQAKDALYDLRKYAGDKTRAQIDEYLVEWLGGGYYEGRAKAGRVGGREIIRDIGRPAAPKLLEGARRILIKPAGSEGEHIKMGDQLLVALANTGDPAAAEFVIDLAIKDYKDESLPKRALAAMHDAYVEPAQGTPIPGRDPLLPHVQKLAVIAKDENLPGEMNNDAVDLIAAVGPPECVPPFVEMASLPAAQSAFRWVGAQRGLRCGGALAIVPILEAVPKEYGFERALLEKYLWKEILAAPGAKQVADQLRELLKSSSWVARVTGIEVLGMMKNKETAAEDAKRIRALAGERTVLGGWWGKQKDVPPGKKKKDPTLGQVAQQVAADLEALAK